MGIKLKQEFGTQKSTRDSLMKNLPLIIFLIFLMNCSGARPPLIGQFSVCPNKPNCVSSKSTISIHKIDPIIYKGTSEDAQEKILGIIKSMRRTKISENKDNFIHVEFTSKIFGFVDDVELYFNEVGTIHFRSASRIGNSDMGVNRKRMEEIHQSFMGKN